MNIIWLSWKDIEHPLSGGAEYISDSMRRELTKSGHKVVLITSSYPGSKNEETTDGITIHRVGNKYSVYFEAYRIIRSKYRDWSEIIIDEMNTIPFFSGLYNKKSKNILLFYQLAREVWFYQMIFPLSFIGYLLEPVMLRVLSHKYDKVLTESLSSAYDIKKYGFSKVELFRINMALIPLTALPDKPNRNIVLSLGAIRPMKRTLDAIKSFEYAKDLNDELFMIIAGDNTSSYAKKLEKYISSSRHSKSIEVLGKVSKKRRLELMNKAGIIIVTSIKEGWGLIVTEAASQGTPAVVYDADGLRDSVIDGKTGIVCRSEPHEMGNAIIRLLSDEGRYSAIRVAAWENSKQYTLKNSFDDFSKILF